MESIPKNTLEVGTNGNGEVVINHPDLMLKMAGHITDSWDSIELWLRLAIEV
jgi:hypothetical protein